MDNQSPCPVFSSLMERYANVVGLVPLVIELGIGNAKDGPGIAALSTESMRLLGKSDVLRLKQSALAGIALLLGLFDLDRINGIKGVVCPLNATAPSSDTGLDRALLPIGSIPEPPKGWVLSTRTYIAMASLLTVPLVVYMLYLLIKQAIHNSRLCKRSAVKKETQPAPMDGELIDVRDWASVDEDRPQPAISQPGLENTEDEAGSNFVFKSASFIFSKLSVLPAALPLSLPTSLPFSLPGWLPTVPLPSSMAFVSPVTGTLIKTAEIANLVMRKSSDCIVDALAPFVFGALLMLTTATRILLYGVGHVGIAKIAESGIFGLNEDAIDTLLEMIHMQWRLMRQLKWSWWFSVAGRYESRCQYGSRQEKRRPGTEIESEPETEPEPEPEHVHGHHICTDAACPFHQVIVFNEPQTDVLADDGAQSPSAKNTKTKEKHPEIKAKSDTVIEAKAAKATDNAAHHTSRRHHHHHHQHHHAGHGDGEVPEEHIKLATRRDWFRWLVRGKDGNGSHYRDRHQRHNVNNAPPKEVKADKTVSKKDKPGQSTLKAAKAVAE